MNAIFDAADAIGRTGGTSLNKVVRASHFVADRSSMCSILSAWSERLPNIPLPFGAARTDNMPIPGCDIILDMWAYWP